MIAIDAGNWDLHTSYGTISWGTMQYNIDGLAQSLAAFFDDLGAAAQRVTVVTISEFGRRVAENGSQGFDHGWGNMMLVAGAGVKGGQYYGSWPGLDPAALSDGDLKVTTDYRNVLGEIVAAASPTARCPAVPGPVLRPLGFMKSAKRSCVQRRRRAATSSRTRLGPHAGVPGSRRTTRAPSAGTARAGCSPSPTPGAMS